MDRDAILQRWQANTILIEKRWLLLQFHANTITARRVVREIGLARTAIANAEYEARMARWEGANPPREGSHLPLPSGYKAQRTKSVEEGTHSRKSSHEFFGDNAQQNTREMSIDDWISGRG